MFRFRGFVTGLLLAACCGLMFSPSIVRGQKTDARAQDEAALRQASKEYLSALQRNDRKAMAEFWMPEGIYVEDDGQSFKIKDLIDSAEGSKDVARPQTKVTGATLRFLTTDSAIEDGTSEITAPGKSSPVKGRFSAVWVRKNGKWKLDSLRESKVVAAQPVTERLSGLEPFLGEWSGHNANSTVRVTANWNSAKTYMRRDISVTAGGKVVFAATQQVGWDPMRGQIRSWVFDVDGGYGEGLWSLEGNVWMVAARGVHPNGKKSQATHIFKFTDRDTIVWKSMDASVDGQPTPDAELTLTRGDKAPGDKTPAEKARSVKTQGEKPAPATPAAPAAASADAAKKAALLASDAWRKVQSEYKEWVSMQVIYTPQQVAESNAKLNAEINKMSAAEFQQFIGELDGKLKTLLSKDAMEARAWLGQYLSRFTDGYRKKFVGDVPDFVDMTSTQMEAEYLKLRSKVLQRQREQASSDASRSELVGAQLQRDSESRAAAQQAIVANNENRSANTYQSQYSPRAENRLTPPPQMAISVGPLGGISYALPGSSY